MSDIKKLYFFKPNDWFIILLVICVHIMGITTLIYAHSATSVNTHITQKSPIILINNAIPNTSIVIKKMHSKPLSTSVNSDIVHTFKQIKQVNQSLSKPSVSKSLLSKSITIKSTPPVMPVKSNRFNQLIQTVKQPITSPTILSLPIATQSTPLQSKSPTSVQINKDLHTIQPMNHIQFKDNVSNPTNHAIKTANPPEMVPDTKQLDIQTVKDSSEQSNDTHTSGKSGSSKQVALNHASDTLEKTTQATVKTSAIFNADYLNNPAPIYPNISRLRGETGKVLLRVQVNTEGRPSRIDMHRSSGNQSLDEAAIKAVNKWNFIPAKVDGSPINSTVIVPIEFKLDELD